MRGHAYLTSFGTVLLAAVLAPWAPTHAQTEGASYCVTCSGPDQTYLCHVTGEGLRQSDALKLYCVIRTAKEGGHASCGARNQVSDCHGVVKNYNYEGPDLSGNFGASPGVAEPRGPADATEAEGEGPKTLVEATGRAVSASRRGIRNVRASLGRGSEQTQSPLPGSAAPLDPLPDLPAQAAEPLPLSVVPKHSTEAARLEPEITTPPPAESTGRIRRGAKSVGSFARGSYRCVRSLFRKCREETDASGPN